MAIDADKDQVEYFDARENKKVTSSLTEIEKQIEATENERVAKIKEKQKNTNGHTL